MDKKLRIAERLAGSIKLDDPKLIDEIIESEIWNYDEENESGNEKHHNSPGECHSPIDAVRLWQSQNPGKGDYSKERSHVCDLGIDEIFQGIERMKKEKRELQKMTDDIAGDKTAALRQSKTRQFYGFVGEANYNEAFIEELSRDWEESGYDGCDIPMCRDERIGLDPKIAHGKPVIRGTRVTVAVILGALAEGMQIDEAAREYGIEQEDVRAAIGYAARIVSQIAI